MLNAFKYKKELELLKKDYSRSEAVVGLLKGRIDYQEKEKEELQRKVEVLTKKLTKLAITNSSLVDIINKQQEIMLRQLEGKKDV